MSEHRQMSDFSQDFTDASTACGNLEEDVTHNSTCGNDSPSSLSLSSLSQDSRSSHAWDYTPPSCGSTSTITTTREMSDYSQDFTDASTVCDNLEEDVTHNSTCGNDSPSSLSWGSLSWDSRSSHAWDYRPPSCGSTSITTVSEMSDFNQDFADPPSACDNLEEDVTHNSTCGNDSPSSLSLSSLSQDGRSSHAWDYTPPSCGSFSTITTVSEMSDFSQDFADPPSACDNLEEDVTHNSTCGNDSPSSLSLSSLSQDSRSSHAWDYTPPFSGPSSITTVSEMSDFSQDFADASTACDNLEEDVTHNSTCGNDSPSSLSSSSLSRDSRSSHAWDYTPPSCGSFSTITTVSEMSDFSQDFADPPTACGNLEEDVTHNSTCGNDSPSSLSLSSLSQDSRSSHAWDYTPPSCGSFSTITTVSEMSDFSQDFTDPSTACPSEEPQEPEGQAVIKPSFLMRALKKILPKKWTKKRGKNTAGPRFWSYFICGGRATQVKPQEQNKGEA